MKLATRLMLILTLTLPLAPGMLAQETAATETTTTTTTATTTAGAATAERTETDATATTSTATTAEGERAEGESEQPVRNSYQIRQRFISLLRNNHPPELTTILKLDPTLLSNEPFLSGYPDLARFLEQNPEVRRNPRFYLADFQTVARNESVFEEFIETLAVFAGFGLAIFIITWLIRTIIEQKRWNRLSRTQTEVHNKILDRFGSSEELLTYIKTPAGSKFLEAAPIPLHVERPVQNTPLSRVMRSVQIGVVLAAAGFGMLLVSLRFDGETAEGFFALGGIAFCLGAGFVASALVAILLSRRLGLWDGEEAVHRGGVFDDGVVK